MNKSTTTKCLELKQLIEDNGSQKQKNDSDLTEAKSFINSLTGIEFNDTELAEHSVKIVDCLNSIQTTITKFRQQF